MNNKQIQNSIHYAFNILLKNDSYLLEANANERSITHKLAEYLQDEFPDWNVDCEYNRKNFDPKKLYSFIRDITSDDLDAVSVYPDVIIHQRGKSKNLVVIEVKKSNSRAEDLDEEKLRAYKKDLGYKFAYKINLPIKSTEKDMDVLNFVKLIV